MKRRFVILLVILIYIITAFKVLSDIQNEKEKRSVSDFSSIKVEDGIDVNIEQGNATLLTVECQSGDIDKVRSEVNNGTLHLYKAGSSWTIKNVKAYITIKQLKMIKASGGSDVESENIIKGSSLELEASGGSDIEMELEYDILSCDLSGGSDMELEGSVDKMEVNASGGSDIEAENLKVRVAEISLSGGSDAELNVTGDISINASGGSDMEVKGGARVVRQNNDKSSDIQFQ